MCLKHNVVNKVSHKQKMNDPIKEGIRSHKRYNRHWVLGEPYNYEGLWYKDKRAYYAKLHHEWCGHVDESIALVKDLHALNCPRLRKHSLTMPRHNIMEYATTIYKLEKRTILC